MSARSFVAILSCVLLLASAIPVESKGSKTVVTTTNTKPTAAPAIIQPHKYVEELAFGIYAVSNGTFQLQNPVKVDGEEAACATFGQATSVFSMVDHLGNGYSPSEGDSKSSKIPVNGAGFAAQKSHATPAPAADASLHGITDPLKRFNTYKMFLASARSVLSALLPSDGETHDMSSVFLESASDFYASKRAPIEGGEFDIVASNWSHASLVLMVAPETAQDYVPQTIAVDISPFLAYFGDISNIRLASFELILTCIEGAAKYTSHLDVVKQRVTFSVDASWYDGIKASRQKAAKLSRFGAGESRFASPRSLPGVAEQQNGTSGGNATTDAPAPAPPAKMNSDGPAPPTAQPKEPEPESDLAIISITVSFSNPLWNPPQQAPTKPMTASAPKPTAAPSKAIAEDDAAVVLPWKSGSNKNPASSRSRNALRDPPPEDEGDSSVSPSSSPRINILKFRVDKFISMKEYISQNRPYYYGTYPYEYTMISFGMIIALVIGIATTVGQNHGYPFGFEIHARNLLATTPGEPGEEEPVSHYTGQHPLQMMGGSGWIPFAPQVVHPYGNGMYSLSVPSRGQRGDSTLHVTSDD